MLVPTLKLPTRIVAVVKSEFDLLKEEFQCDEATHTFHLDDRNLLVREEFQRGKEDCALGVVLAYIDVDETLDEKINSEIDINSMGTFSNAYSNHGHKRDCANHLGLAAYRLAARGMKKVHPTAVVADSEIDIQDYSHGGMKNYWALLSADQELQQLGKLAVEFGKPQLPAIYAMPQEELCDRVLITCGNLCKTSGFLAFLSFVNALHIDKLDRSAAERLQLILESIDDATHKKTLQRISKIVGLGAPTTCLYKHLWGDTINPENYEVNSFFLHYSVGVAHPLLNLSGFSFLGHAYAHLTSFCYLLDMITLNVILRNPLDVAIFLMLAWGNGGKKQNKTRRQRFHGVGGQLVRNDGGQVRVTQTRMTDYMQNHLNGAQRAVWDEMTEADQERFIGGEDVDFDPALTPNIDQV